MAENYHDEDYLACIDAMRSIEEDDVTVATITKVPSELKDTLSFIIQLQAQSIEQISYHKSNIEVLSSKLQHYSEIRHSILYPEYETTPANVELSHDEDYLACINAMKSVDEDDISAATLTKLPSELNGTLHLIIQLQAQTIEQMSYHKTKLKILSSKLQQLNTIRQSILYPGQ
ncbi:hypothetical protein BG000_001233 [Podila horticola]|nr:hypothetical protein BG000_001233 [Podila horticola]